VKTNTAKQKMLAGQPVLGFTAKLGSPVAAEFLSHCGADFVSIDTQHGSWGDDSVVAAVTAICAGPATPMARVLNNQYHLMARLLDAGVLGIIAPMVDTVEQAEAVAAACRYPPVGQRSFGWGRAVTYGADYADRIGEELFVAVQIESAQALANAEAILAVPGIDGCMVGPQDLALSMGFHPRDIPTHDEHRLALERIVQACHNTGKIPGIDTGGPETGLLRVEQGFLFVVMGSDVRFVQAGTSAALAGVRTAAAVGAPEAIR
jgi:4-hydroxy-2-oxoheptanedioate aldolase